jgi:hypothetical protein
VALTAKIDSISTRLSGSSQTLAPPQYSVAALRNAPDFLVTICFSRRLRRDTNKAASGADLTFATSPAEKGCEC